MDIGGSALVTGASRGIGRAVAVELAQRGFDVVAAMRTPADGADLPALAAEGAGGGGRITVVGMDVTDPGSISVPDDLRVLVNNAGLDVDHTPVEHADASAWRDMFETNVIGTLHMCQAAIPVLRDNAPGVIANLTSSSILAPVAFYAGYRGTKAAVSAMCDTLRVELAPFGVRIVEILPGPVDTDMFQVTRGVGPAARHALYRAMAEAAEEQRRLFADPMVVPASVAAVAITDALLDDGGPMRYSCDPLGTGLLDMWRQNDDEALYRMVGGGGGDDGSSGGPPTPASDSAVPDSAAQSHIPSPAPDAVMPDSAVPGGVVPDGVVPGGVVPDEVVLGGVVPDDVVPGGVVPDDVVPGGVVPGGVVPGGVVPDEVVLDGVVRRHVPGGVVSNDVVLEANRVVPEGVVRGHVPGHLLTAMGMRRVEDPEAGPTLEMDVRPEVTNPHGGLHGGLMAVLIECGAAGVAVRAGDSEMIVAGDMLIRFLSPARVGPARIVGRVLKAGRRQIVVQADVVDVGDDRRLVASATLAYARL
jgi:uncharacterized protein (TIGR00369 family)